MFTYCLSSLVFNKLLKRLLLLSNSDQEAIVTFEKIDNLLKIYYHSKAEKGGSNILFYEELPIELSSTGSGLASLYINQLFSIKVPESSSEEKHPYCREVEFNFTEKILNVKYIIKWSKATKPNETNLKFPLLEKPTELNIYKSMILFDRERGKKVSSRDFIEGLSLCNFIKSDVTSRDSNGCLLKEINNNLHIVATDSTIAVKYVTPIVENIDNKEFSLVLSSSTLNSIKNFLVDTEIAIFTKVGNSLLVESENKRMVSPIMKVEFIILDLEEFFNINNDEYIGRVDLKPLINSINTLSSNNVDLYKKIELEFTDRGVDISTSINKAKDLPAENTKKCKLFVNSDYLYLSSQRLVTLGFSANFYYNKENSRLTLTSMNDKLLFLIQGLSF